LSPAEGKIVIRRVNRGVILTVRLTPKSSHDEIEGGATFDGETLIKARVRALPEDGHANAALERLIADWLDMPPRSVKVIQGGKSRIKQVFIEGDPESLERVIKARLAELTS
jgi:uncharacterized protein YggU (UPF0235/DUF167 family)